MNPLLEYLTQGKASSHANFAKPFGDPLLRFLQDARGAGHDISVFSGYRDPAHQARLFDQALKKYGSVAKARKNVAPAPDSYYASVGRKGYGSTGSRHNFGVGADLRYSTPASRKWAHANANKYGLNFRMGHEPWHIEPINSAQYLGSGHPSGMSGGQGLMDQIPNARPRGINSFGVEKFFDQPLPELDFQSKMDPRAQAEEILLKRGMSPDQAATYSNSFLTAFKSPPAPQSRPAGGGNLGLPRPRPAVEPVPRSRPIPSATDVPAQLLPRWFPRNKPPVIGGTPAPFRNPKPFPGLLSLFGR